MTITDHHAFGVSDDKDDRHVPKNIHMLNAQLRDLPDVDDTEAFHDRYHQRFAAVC